MTKKLISLLAFVITLFVCIATINAAPYDVPQKSTFDFYFKIWQENLLYSGTDAVIAARSKAAPDYYYDWARDTALAMRAMGEVYGRNSTEILTWYERYERNVKLQLSSEIGTDGTDIRAQAKFYITGEPFDKPWCHHQTDGPGLRVMVRTDYAFNLIARGQMEKVKSEMWLANGAKPGLKWELDYLQKAWKERTCCLWEEVHAMHFWTLTAIRKGLVWGARLAYAMGEDDYALEVLTTALEVSTRLQHDFVNDEQQMIWPMLDIDGSSIDRLGFDTAILLALTVGDMASTTERSAELTGDLNLAVRKHYQRAKCKTPIVKFNQQQQQQTAPFVLTPQLKADPCGLLSALITMTTTRTNLRPLAGPYLTDSHALHSYSGLINWSLENYAVNSPQNLAKRGYKDVALVARYPNDEYDGADSYKGGGNPWILSNFVFGETMLQIGQQLIEDGSITFHTVNIDFINKVWSTVTPRDAQCDVAMLNGLINNIQKNTQYRVADQTILKCLKNAFYYYGLQTVNLVHDTLGLPTNLNEQINKNTGSGTGANYLTWSYSTYLSFYKQYQKVKF